MKHIIASTILAALAIPAIAQTNSIPGTSPTGGANRPDDIQCEEKNRRPDVPCKTGAANLPLGKGSGAQDPLKNSTGTSGASGSSSGAGSNTGSGTGSGGPGTGSSGTRSP